MFVLRRQAVQSARGIRTARSTAQFSSSTSRTAHEAGHGHAAPKDEPLGLSVYMTLAAIPAVYIVYSLAQPSADGKKPALERLINSYSHLQDTFAARNKLHTAAIEQAAFDRNLFQSDRKTEHVNLRFPETFNTGSPHNVIAGQGPRDIEKLVAHYEQLNNAAEEKKVLPRQA
ncbi:hypothetical protein VF21_09081 [Pseudogymnoascus sp. 05NY08]|nr:hypothetical protein VF21_09081 [Pseudogymnoascus sp. 05NY08]